MRVVVPEEADGFLAAHPRMHGNFHRTGRGSSPTHVTAFDTGLARTTSTHFGFPVVGDLELHPDFVGCGLITENGGSLRWRGDEGTAGEAVFFTGGVHVPVSLPDQTTVRTVSAPIDAVRTVADDLGRPLAEEMVEIVAGPAIPRVRRAIRLHQRCANLDRYDPYVDDEILAAFVDVLAAPGVASTSRSRVSSSRIVSEVVGFLEAAGRWRVSTVQMCRVAHVSERRLQLAFHDMYRVAPATFVRQRALWECRRALLAADPRDIKVSDVALDHGFHHLSRFASTYRTAFGELPSQTLSRRS
jgi:AraC-like DNA-binding protein